MVCAAGLATLLATNPGFGQCETPRLSYPAGATGDAFGGAVSVSGARAIVGAPFHDELGADAGAAIVYRYDHEEAGWVLEAVLHASDGAAGDRFGFSVSISGDRAVVGAIGHDTSIADAGAAYVFRFDAASETWVQEAKLVAADGKAHNLGYSVSIDGQAVIAGSVRDDAHAGISGSARIFRRNPTTGAWVEEKKLVAGPNPGNDRFALAVAISGNVVVIGAPWDSDVDIFAGSAHVFRRIGTTWTFEAELHASEGNLFEYFGTSVDVDGALVAVGAENDGTNGFNAGSVYVYRHDGAAWNEEIELLPADGGSNDRFGCAVSVSGQSILAGAPGDSPAGTASGSAYVFRFDGTAWGEGTKLVPDGAAAGDEFGAAVALHQDLGAIGAPKMNGSGAVVAYLGASGADCDNNGVADGCDLAACAALDGNGDGIPDGCEPNATTYIGPPGGSWFNPAHWSSGAVPTIIMRAVVPGEVVIDAAGAKALSVRVVCGGRLTFANGGLLTQRVTATAGGVVDGTGWITGVLSNDGLVDPGAPIGTLTVEGTYEQTPMGTLHVDLGGTLPGFSHDRLQVLGSASFRGVISGSVVAPYTPAAGDALDIITYYSDLGGFSTSLLPGLDGDLVFRGSFDPGRLRLQVVEATPVAPCAAGVLDDAPHFMSIGGDVATIGTTVYRYDPSGCEGAVCLPWSEEQILEPPADAGSTFGRASARSGDWLIVGANTGGPAGTGAAYGYRFDGAMWQLEQTLLPFGGGSVNRFGWSVAMDGDLAIVGTFWGNGLGPPGKAYVFRLQSGAWVGEQVLQASDGADNGGSVDGFGQAVALDGEVAVIGAFNDDANGFVAGSAYVFRRDGAAQSWKEEAKLLASDGAPVNYFGHSVDVSGTSIVVGAVGLADGQPAQSGYVFRRAAGQWVEQVELAAPLDIVNIWFQTKIVAIENGVVLVSTYNDDGGSETTGSTYVFRNNGWSWERRARLLPQVNTVGWFGYSVAFGGHTALIAAFDPLLNRSREVQVYLGADGIDCNGNGIGDACDILAGTSMDDDGNGIPDECDIVLGDINADGVVNGVDLMLLLAAWGACPADAPCPADLNGDGFVTLQDLQILLSNWG